MATRGGPSVRTAPASTASSRPHRARFKGPDTQGASNSAALLMAFAFMLPSSKSAWGGAADRARRGGTWIEPEATPAPGPCEGLVRDHSRPITAIYDILTAFLLEIGRPKNVRKFKIRPRRPSPARVGGHAPLPRPALSPPSQPPTPHGKNLTPHRRRGL